MLLDWGLLLMRVVIGLILAGHGAQKLFDLFGGHGHAGTREMMRHMGISPAGFWAWLAGLSEFGGGLLFALGLLSPLGTLGITASMLMAIIQVHWPKGLWNTEGGYELPLTYMVVALGVALTGPGIFSLDYLLHIALPEPLSLLIGLIAVIVGVLAAFAGQRYKAAHQAPAH